MAVLRTYKCTACGYKVMTEPQGHYALLSGQHYNFRCHQCNEIISLSTDELIEKRFDFSCPECHGTELSTWNPVEGRCPRCGAPMEEDTDGPVIMAD